MKTPATTRIFLMLAISTIMTPVSKPAKAPIMKLNGKFRLRRNITWRISLIIVLVSALLFGTMTQAADVTSPGDTLQAFPNDGDWPGNERPPMAIDDDIMTKYLHFKGDFDPDPGTGGTGFRVTPSSAQTVVIGLTFTTANDYPGRDPVAYRFSGSNVSIDGPYTLIAEGDIVDFDQASEWPRHTKNTTPIFFPNETAYDHYQLLLTAIRGGSDPWINGMQIAEVELLEQVLKAHSPIPADASENMGLNDNGGMLSWSVGDSSVRQYAFFGTSESGVAGAGTRSPEFMGSLSAMQTTLTPAREPGVTYYWRIDQEESDGNIVRGDVWSFGTAPLKAIGPVPADGAELVDPNADLSWTGGWDSFSGFDVYFGTSQTDVTNATTESPECVSIGRMLPSYDPGPLRRDTTYYWRIDDKGATTYKGDTWNFTTIWWVIPTNKPGYVPCLPGIGGDLRTSAQSTVVLTVDTNDRRQTIHNFGASDAWSIQYVGLWPDAKRNPIADLLFETGLDENNNPKGIGLSLWRFFVGAGSNRQSYISDPWRRSDLFLSSDFNSYDWSAQPGQRWFLQAAKARGVEQFIAFCGSPPINMTKNGRSSCDSNSGTTNLISDKIDDFAAFLTTMSKHFSNVEGINFGHISPVGEPHWDWDGTDQEGCRYDNSDIKVLVDALHSELDSQQVTTQILIPEAGDIGYLCGHSSTRGDYIDSFFSDDNPNYVGDKVAQGVACHSYFAGWPEDDRLVGMREYLHDKLDQYPGLEYWATEYCILIPGDWWVPVQYWGYGNGRDLGIDPALWIARVIHHDLTVAEASAWQWWLGVSPYDYKDGLVYVDKSESDGNYYHSKLLWAMGNFSRFIRPGMERVIVNRSDNATPRDTVKDLMVSAYYNSDDGIVVVVFVNWANKDKTVDLEFLGADPDILIPYVTKGNSADNDNLTAYRLLSPDDTIAIPARSVVTIVGIHGDPHDRDSDGDVDFADFAGFGARWLQTDCGKCGGVDFTDDGKVGPDDLEQFAAEWLRCAIPGLAAWWKLDEKTGAIAYDAAGDKDATLHGDPNRLPAGGRIDGALELDGIDDYLSTPFVLNPADGPFSVYAWIKGGEPGQQVVSQTDGEGIGVSWLCAETSTGTLMTGLHEPGRGGRPLVSEFVITDGDWHRIGFVWDGTYRSLYVDGTKVKTDTAARPGLVGSTGGLHIGAAKDLDPNCFFAGLTDDVRVYDRAVTP
ncbi:MAG: hypothetical protein JXN61_15465 [Sedimentisphaerales bacterium]|nr:hypothetical protein [Sedimentisphaerales bacterium]